MIQKTPLEAVTLEAFIPPEVIRLRNKGERMRAGYEVVEKMKRVSEEQRCEVLKELKEKTGVQADVDEQMESEMLNWDEVRQIAKDPLMEIGSHTVSHRMLTHLQLHDIQWELKHSQEILEREIGKTIDFLSYPNNRYNERVCVMAKEMGYRAAFIVDQSPCLPLDNAYSLPRIHIEGDSMPSFMADLSLMTADFSRFFCWLKSLTAKMGLRKMQAIEEGRVS